MTESGIETGTGAHFVRTWQHIPRPRASVLIVHGYGEHSGRYSHVARALNARDIAVHAFDMPGMGRSAGRRGRIDSVEALDRDLKAIAATRLGDGRPAFLLGHSFGGLLVARHLLYFGHRYEGAIFSAPAFLPRPVLPPWMDVAPRILSRILPAAPVMMIRRRHLSRDESVVMEAKRDALNTGRVVDVRTGWEITRAGRNTLELIGSITTPLLVMQGSGDRIVDPRGGYLLYEKAASEDKTLMLFEGGYHEPLNDTIRDDAVRCVLEWVEERVPSGNTDVVPGGRSA